MPRTRRAVACAEDVNVTQHDSVADKNRTRVQITNHCSLARR